MSQRRNTFFGSMRRRYTAALVLAAAGLAACSAEKVTAPGHAAPSESPVMAISGSASTTGMTAFSSLSLSGSQFDSYKSSWYTGAGDQFSSTKRVRTFGCGMSTAQGRATIPTTGGTISVNGHTFTVPSGALSASTTITATFTTSPSGAQVDLWPHGLHFAKPTTIQFNLNGCSVPSGTALNVYYVDDNNYVRQVMPSTTGTGNIRALTDHFSGFAVGWGVY